MARPFILYENLLEDATLIGSSTTVGYDVDSVKTRVTSDRWRSGNEVEPYVQAQLAAATLPTALAITRHFLNRESQASYEIDSSDFSTTESPLATGWTDVGDETLQATGGKATDAAQATVTAPDVRHYVRSGGDAFQGNGAGYVEAVVNFSSASAPASQAGVSARSSSDGSYVSAILVNTGSVFIQLYNGASTLTSFGAAVSVSASTDYTIRLVIVGATAYLYLDGTLEDSTDFSSFMPSSWSPNQQGIIQLNSTPASNTTTWDDFSAGEAGDPTLSLATMVLRGGTDGSTWPYERVYFLEDDATFIAKIDDASSYGHWQVRFPQSSATAITIGCLALGRRLDLTESMAQGFDPSSERLVTHQNRSNSGEFLGQVARYPIQSTPLKFGPAGLSTTDFFNQTGTPSWEEFNEDNWRLGRPHWFAWDITQRPRDMWFCMVPQKARSSAPFITAIRRGWRTTWDVLVERVSR